MSLFNACAERQAVLFRSKAPTQCANHRYVCLNLLPLRRQIFKGQFHSNSDMSKCLVTVTVVAQVVMPKPWEFLPRESQAIMLLPSPARLPPSHLALSHTPLLFYNFLAKTLTAVSSKSQFGYFERVSVKEGEKKIGRGRVMDSWDPGLILVKTSHDFGITDKPN